MTFTWQDLERVVGENAVPQQEHLLTGQVAREGSDQPLEGNLQPATTGHC